MIGLAVLGLAFSTVPLATAAPVTGSEGETRAVHDNTADDSTLARTSGPRQSTARDLPQWPEAEWGGDIYIIGVTRGYAFFDDHDFNGTRDRDNFFVVDAKGDGASVTLTITHKGKKYTKHAYYGETKKIDVGDIKNGTTVHLKGCGWDNGRLLGCAENELTE